MVRLRRGDCLKRLKELPDSCIDLIVMDPPYEQKGGSGAGAFGGKHRSYYDEISDMSNGISYEVLSECIRVLKKINMYIYCNKTQIKFYMDFFDAYDINFNLLCWHKTNPIPTTSNIYLRDTEYILFFREKGVKLYGSYATKKTWFLSSVNKKDKNLYNHPTVKPIEQARIFIENSSLKGDTVLDPYMGSGTIGVAAVELGRSFIGIELNKSYYKTSKSRIKSALEKLF